MPNGPGKYDQQCVTAMMQTESAAVVLVVLGGNEGSGFSVNVDPARVDAVDLISKLPDMLREVARQIEETNS